MGIETKEENEMKHKHYEMIVAKAANMDLVLFVKLMNAPDFNWVESVGAVNLPFDEEGDYFLCLLQHNESGQCLHWLNGGEIEIRNKTGIATSWSDFPSFSFNPKWIPHADFMSKDCDTRIKPKKEKRWIGVAKDKTTDATFKTKEGCMEYVKGEYIPSFVDNCQFIEIEVEV